MRKLISRKKSNGFTLVEIITILAIISILLIFSYISAPTILARVRDAVRKGGIDRMTKAVEEYYENNNCYPIALPVCKGSIKDGEDHLLPYIPCDPSTKLSYVYVSEDSDCPSWFQLYGNLEYEEDSIIDRIGCREGCGPDCQFNYGESSTNQKLDPYCESSPPAPSGEPFPTPSPGPGGGGPEQYVCAPSGACEAFDDPVISGCPDIYPDDPTCQEQCGEVENQCHDSRGKFIPN